tara:strand:- start:322 stop:528 length:207 start_codon:yes stop_codon:yes gene_type:complete
MNEDNLNMEIRKFLKKVGINSQRFLEKEINEAFNMNLITDIKEIELEMTLSIKSLNKQNIIKDKIKIL